MKIYFDAAGTFAGLASSVGTALKDGAGCLVILAAEGNGFAPEQLNPLLTELKVSVAGGVFPAVIHGGKTFTKGTVVLGFAGRSTAGEIRALGSAGTDLETTLEKLSGASSGARTMLVFVDGFSPRITPFINSLFYIFGLEINYIGGGAGSLAGGNGPCLFSNSGMFSDGAVMALVDIPSGLGVAHGWLPMGDPMQATSVSGNILKELDFQPALEVYSAVAAPGLEADEAGFDKVCREHPFGIARLDREMIVRDPLKINPDGSIVCAGDIPPDAYVHIMTSSNQSLTAAAAAAAKMAIEALPSGKPEAFLLMDCISRYILMGKDFERELQVISQGPLPSAGACTIGEIANSGAEFLEFYNKTVVAAAMGAR